MFVCPNCGTNLEAEDKLCTKCGAVVSENTELSQPSSKMKKYKIHIIIIAMLLFLITAAGIATRGAAPLRAKFDIMLGNKYSQDGKYEKAILAFEKSIRLEEKDIDSRLKLSELYIITEQNDKAKRLLNETLVLDKANQNTYVLFASIYEKEKNYVKLIKLLSEGLSQSREKDKLQSEFDKLLAEINIPEINATVEQDEKYILPQLAQLQIGEDKFELLVDWEGKNVDTSKIGNEKLEGNIQYINKPIIVNLDIKLKPVVVTEKKITKTGKKYVINYRVPVISMEGRYSEHAIALSSAIEDYFNKSLTQDLELAKAAAEDQYLKGDKKYDFGVGYKVTYNKDGIISILMTYGSYSGGAHGLAHNIAYNYNIIEGRELELQDAFNKDVNSYNIVKEEIVKQMKAKKDIFFDDSIDIVKNYSEPFEFYITEHGVVIYFEEYEVGPFASGIPEFLITRNIAIK